MDINEIKNEIIRLKKEKNALILVHNYQREEIKEYADYMGDSLELSKLAVNEKRDLIVFCGVKFMAETAKILSPNTKVLIPRLDADCPMADMADILKIQELKRKYPQAKVCAYVNTYAEIKAISDVCCTSSNAVKIVNSLDTDTVIMVPDKNLARWTMKNTKKKIILYEGFCYVHRRFTLKDVLESKKKHPDAYILAHPECDPEILEAADEVASTSGMIKCVKNTDYKEFILITERGVAEQLSKEFPDRKFYSAGSAKSCYNMKKITLVDLFKALKYEQFEIKIEDSIIKNAKKALDLMLKLSK